MKENTVRVEINKPLHEVFVFCITPPNSSRWIPGIVDEKTNEWPVRVGTVYRLQNKHRTWSEVVVNAIKDNELVEFAKGDYHCTYTFKVINEHATELTYREWVDSGELEPFAPEVLETLKRVVESAN